MRSIAVKASIRLALALTTTGSPASIRRSVSTVIRLRYVVRVPFLRRTALSRKAVFIRDHHRCQYCGGHADSIDHIIPRSRGGATTWTNVVTACSPCNLQKGNRMLRESGLVLRRFPSEPTTQELQENGRGFPPGYLHESWRDFLYWDSELDQT